jgi:hypothetical protein|eukprot:jgi/Chrpa1/27688/Chrysochromulina_OHIO_Genome00011875-RA
MARVVSRVVWTLTGTLARLHSPSSLLLHGLRSQALHHLHAPAVIRRALTTEATLSAAGKEVQRVFKAMCDAKETCSDHFEPSLDAGSKLLLDLGKKGQYSLEVAPGDKLLLFSPITGPKYYKYDPQNRWWAAVDDGHLLEEILVRELMHITSVCLNM